MSVLSFDELKALWIRNGGNPTAAPIMAAIALAESGGRTDAANTKPPDASYGLWQINYYGSLAPGRTQAYGTPAQLVADPDRQAKAAISISGNGKNLQPWTTYTSGAAQTILTKKQGGLPNLPSLTLSSPTPDPTGGSVDNEGDLFSWGGTKVLGQTVVPGLSMKRSTARKIVGASVLGVGGIVALAGVFVLVGGGKALPGNLGALQGAVGKVRGRGVDRRYDRAKERVENTTPDELDQRRRNRDRERRERAQETEYWRTERTGTERFEPFD